MIGVSIKSGSNRIRPAWLDAFAVQAGAAAAQLVVLGVGALLLWRRLGAAASVSLPPRMLLATASLAGVMVIGGRLLCRNVGGDIRRPQWRWLSGFIDLGGTAALVLLAVGSSYPGDRLMDWLAWAAVIGLDAWVRQGSRTEPGIPMAEKSRGQATTETAIHFLAPRRPDASETFEGGELLDDTLLQETRRIRGADGIETICAALRAEFVAGQRHAVLHLGFCPPFSHLPEVDVEAGEGPEAEVRVVQAFAHGARLEVRLTNPAEEACSVLVELSATPRR